MAWFVGLVLLQVLLLNNICLFGLATPFVYIYFFLVLDRDTDINVLLLADPAKGVDVGAKKDLYDFILNLVKEKNMSVVLYASDSDELISYCDRLLIMYEGDVVSELVGAEITEDNIVARSMRVE